MVKVDASCPAAVFRGLNVSSTEQWAEQYFVGEFGVDAVKTALAAVLLVISLAFLVRGARLMRPTFFLTGFGACTVATFAAVDAVIGNVPQLSETASCWVLSVLPLVAGLAGGLLALRMLTLAFVFMGAACGVSAGYYVYNIALHAVPIGVTLGQYDLTFWLCLLVGAIIGIIAMLKAEDNLLIVATALLGAVGLLPALTILALARIDARFLWVLDSSARNVNLASPFVYGPLIGVAVAFLLGIYLQRREKRLRERSAEVVPLGRARLLGA